MRLTRRILVLVVVAAAFAIPAPAFGQQDLPSAACNEGTTTAHTSIPEGAAGHEHVPMAHNGGCAHVNPTSP
jgi:hypothetical protein